jgi:hypothetical protein
MPSNSRQKHDIDNIRKELEIANGRLKKKNETNPIVGMYHDHSGSVCTISRLPLDTPPTKGIHPAVNH